MKNALPPKGSAGHQRSLTKAVDASLAHGVPCPHSQDCRRITYPINETAECLHCGQILNRSDLLELLMGAMP
jgi:hypothetical protein